MKIRIILIMMILLSSIATAIPDFVVGTVLFNESFDGATWNASGTFTGDSAFYPTQNDNATLHKGDSATWNFQEVWINDNFPAVDDTQVAWKWRKTGSGGLGIFMCMMDLSQHVIGDSQLASMDFCYYGESGGKIYEEGTDKATSVWSTNSNEDYWLKMNISDDGLVKYWYKTDTATSFTSSWDSTQRINTTFSMVWDVASSSGYSFRIDEVWIWNNSIVSVEPEVDIFILNPDYDKISFSNLTESEPFYVAGNYTLSGLVLEGGNCSFTSLNISAHFVESSIHNYSLNNTQDQLSLIFNETTDNAILDRGELSVCRIKGNSALSVYINGNLHRTTDQSIIPLCSNGIHFITNTSSNYTSQSYINLTLKCDSCSEGVKELKILSIDNERMHLERDYSTHTEPLIFNSTLDYYIYSTNLYHYVRAGVDVGNISMTCNDTTTETIFNLIDKPLNVSITSINEVSYFDGINIESSNLTSIIIEITDDEVVFLDFNVTYPNGSLIKQSSQEFITLTNSQLNIDGFYNISITAIDDEGNTTSQRGYFVINDSTTPVIVWINPIFSGTSIYDFNENITFNISLFDINLFGYNFSFYSPSGILRSNTEVVNIVNLSSVYVSPSILLNESGIWTAFIEVSDNHHLTGINKVESMKVIQETDKLIYDDCISIEFENAITVSSEKQEYYYDFSADWGKDYSISKHIYVHSCNKLYYIESSGYSGHFVDLTDGLWIDFENEFPEKPIVTYFGNNTYQLTYYNLGDNVMFKSIGGLNIINQNTSFTVNEIEIDSELLHNFDLDNQNNVILLFIMVVLYLGCMFIGMQFKNVGFMSIGFFVGVFIGFMLFNYHWLATAVMMFLNISIFYNTALKQQ